MKLCGVVVVFNPENKVNENIKSYLNDLEKLYVIDNSTIDNRKRFKDKKIVYVSNRENKGIAQALNQGIELARKENYEWILTMDQDSKFEKKGLAKFKEKIEKCQDKKVAIFAPLHQTTSKKLNENIKSDTLIVMTSGNILSIKIHQKLGGFKEWLFIDGVDQEYCLNARKNGYKIKVFSEILLQHNLGKTQEKKILGHSIFITNHSATRRYFITRNRLYINQLYKKDFPEFCHQELKNSRREGIKILLFETNKVQKIKAMKKAKKDFKKGIKGLPNDLREDLQ